MKLLITFFFISASELLFILFIVVMVFGANKLPEIARGLGKGMRMLKDATNDIKQEITKTADKNGLDNTIFKSVDNELDNIKDEIEDFAGSVKRKL